MHGASGKRHRVVVASSPRVALLHLLVGKDEQDLGKKSRGGRCRRRLVEGVFATNTGYCTCSPGAVGPTRVVKMHASGARGDASWCTTRFSKIARILWPPRKIGFNFELRTFPDDDNSWNSTNFQNFEVPSRSDNRKVIFRFKNTFL